MINQLKKLQVAVLLPREEPFNHYYGGAIARCIHETYRCLDPTRIDFTILTIGSESRTQYHLPQRTSTRWLK